MIDATQRKALRVQLSIIGGKTPGELIEVRYRPQAGAGITEQKWFDAATELREAERFILAQGAKTDTYVGVAPRVRRGGKAEDVAHARCLWVEIDAADAARAVKAFDPPPALVVASGSKGHLHAYWPLTEPLPAAQVAEHNQRLARALGGDLASTDPARILRPIGTTNHKPDGGAVRCVRFSAAAYNGNRPAATAVVRDLPEPREAALSGAIDVGRGGGVIPEGGRDNWLASQAGAYRRRGDDAATIVAKLRIDNERCDPRLPEKDLARIARSIGKKPVATDPAWLDLSLSDAGNASRLVYDHGDEVLYVPGKGWHAWDGQRWKPDRDGEVMRRARETVGRFRTLGHETKDPKAANALFTFGTRSESKQRLEAMVSLAAIDEEVIAHADDLDADPMLFNVSNGTVDLRTGTLRPHDSGDRIAKLSQVVFEPEAQCPRWDKFLSEVFDGDNDLIAFVQRAIGYTITGDVREEVLFLTYGTGGTGKSKFIDTITALTGDYAMNTNSSSWTTAPKRAVRADLARLPGARLVTATEIGQSSVQFDEALVKQATGGDQLTVSDLYKGEFSYRPKFKLWFTVNHLPIILGDDDAMWQRIRTVPFTITFRGSKQQDNRLLAKLMKELPGILNWAIAGCLDWQRVGLNPPPAVVDGGHEILPVGGR